MCSSRQRLKDEAVPSLILPLKGESKVNESDNVAAESNDCEPVIDVIDQDASPSTSINISLPKTEFSPVKYCHSVSSSPRQGALTDSTLHFPGESNGLKSTTSRRGKCSKRKLHMQVAENIGANSVENSVKLVTDESTQPPNLCSQIVEEIIIDDSPALENVCAEKVQSAFSKDGASSSTEKKCAISEENENKSKARVQIRPSKRLVWKKVELDESTKKMYEEVLDAKKQVDNYKTKARRYHFI